MQKSTIYSKPMGENLATCRIGHIFGFVEGAMNGSLVRSIGMMRAKAANALTNLVYNIFRYVQINRYQPSLSPQQGIIVPIRVKSSKTTCQ